MAQASRSRRSTTGPSPEEAMVNDLIALMEQGTTPWRRTWDGTGGGQHRNLISGHIYRGANPVLLELGMHLRGSAQPLWCGFAEAKKLGIFPRKGSKAVRILRPQLHSREEPQENGETLLRSWATYKPVPMFNVSDLEGEALVGLIAARSPHPGSEPRPEISTIELAEEHLGAWPVPVHWGGDRAFYSPSADLITLPERQAFHSPEALYVTWAHEAIHSSGHHTRLERDLSGAFGSRSYAREELVAELGSILVGQRLQIGCRLEHHAAYMESWIAVLRESPQVLMQVLSQARQAADLVAPEAEQPNNGQDINQPQDPEVSSQKTAAKASCPSVRRQTGSD